MKSILFVSFLFLSLMLCFASLGWAAGLDDVRAGLAAYNQADYDKAIRLHTKAIASGDLSQENLSMAYNNRGLSWGKKGDHDRAMADYNRAIELDPMCAHAHSNLAWLLAVCPESKYRDGMKAIKLAKKAIERNDKSARIDTLAAAYAEAGRFQDAIKTEERTIAKLKEEGNTKGIPEFEEHLASYKAGKPWREK
jgi:tetratricopeptide (TPR) repeat protein